MSRKRLALVGVIIASFSIGAVVALLQLPGVLDPGVKSLTTGRALVGGPFTLTSHTGKRVSDKDFAGRYMLIYFGFTYCPDVCPSGLQVMAAAIDKLGPKGQKIVPILITVDPERDTPEQLAKYVGQFHPRLVGLTGSTEEVRQVAKAYRVYYNKVKDEKSTAGYTVDHSALFLLMDPEGNYAAHFSHGTNVDVMTKRLDEVVR
ncbi:MAG: SCO family protein [Hyphomicrobiaceae bacterium]|nr:MAG: SCO family protein [Hyphomicrobiaceae bacterium]